MSILTAGARVGRGDYPAATTNAEAGGQQTSNCCEAEMRENVGLLAAGDLTVGATLLHGQAVASSRLGIDPAPDVVDRHETYTCRVLHE
jgi:hypothetical protein